MSEDSAFGSADPTPTHRPNYSAFNDVDPFKDPFKENPFKENNTTSKGENNTTPGYSALDFNDVDPFKDANHRYGDPFDIEGNN